MARSASSSYDLSVFVNCPFDSQCQGLFHALVFAVTDCGFIARCALETNDSGAFTAALPQARRELALKKSEVGYKEYANMVAEWLKLHPRP